MQGLKLFHQKKILIYKLSNRKISSQPGDTQKKVQFKLPESWGRMHEFLLKIFSKYTEGLMGNCISQYWTNLLISLQSKTSQELFTTWSSPNLYQEQAARFSFFFLKDPVTFPLLTFSAS